MTTVRYPGLPTIREQQMPAKPRYDQARITVRLDEASLKALEDVMKLTGKSESKIIRAALIEYRKNPQFLGGDLSDKTDYSQDGNKKTPMLRRPFASHHEERTMTNDKQSVPKNTAPVNLTPGQRKFLNSLPRNLFDKPIRGRAKTTVSQLYSMGMIETRGMMAHQKTMCITPAGRAALAAPGGTAKPVVGEPVTTYAPTDSYAGKTPDRTVYQRVDYYDGDTVTTEIAPPASDATPDYDPHAVEGNPDDGWGKCIVCQAFTVSPISGRCILWDRDVEHHEAWIGDAHEAGLTTLDAVVNLTNLSSGYDDKYVTAIMVNLKDLRTVLRYVAELEARDAAALGDGGEA